MVDDLDLSIIIVSFNVASFLQKCLTSIFQSIGSLRAEVIVVDNASSDDSVAMLRSEFPQVQVIANTTNWGFAVANDQAIQVSKGMFILLLNPDTIVQDDALSILVNLMRSDRRIGIAGPKLLNPDGSLQPSCLSFPNPLDISILSFASYRLVPRSALIIPAFLYAWDHAQRIRVPGFVIGAAMMIRREVFERVGVLDPGFFVYSEEKDLCYRAARSGYQIVFEPSAHIVHYGGQSSATISQTAHHYLYNSLCYFMYKQYQPWYATFLAGLLYLGLLVRFISFSVINWLRRTKRRDALMYWKTFASYQSRRQVLAEAVRLRAASAAVLGKMAKESYG
jgi:GT2 family glycosyltransferase